MSLIKEYELGSVEFCKLLTFKKIANKRFEECGGKYRIVISDIYFDYSQNWWYTALITRERYSEKQGWQSVCPRDYEAIVSSDSFSEIEAWAIHYADEVSKGNISVSLSF